MDTNLTGTLGEPRTNPEDATDYLHHWHKGIDIPKNVGDRFNLFNVWNDRGRINTASAEWQENYVHIDFRVFDSEDEQKVVQMNKKLFK